MDDSTVQFEVAHGDIGYLQADDRSEGKGDILARRPFFLLEIPFVICSQWVSLCWFCLCCVVFLSRSWRHTPSFVLVWSLLHWLSKFVVRDGQRWLPNAKNKFVNPG